MRNPPPARLEKAERCSVVRFVRRHPCFPVQFVQLVLWRPEAGFQKVLGFLLPVFHADVFNLSKKLLIFRVLCRFRVSHTSKVWLNLKSGQP